MSELARHATILAALGRDGRVGVAALAQALGVSDETIRRDLATLDAAGRLRRVHGGAVQFRPDEEQPILVRSRIRPREKAQLAAVARGLVKDGMSIFIDTGSTALAFARTLADARDLAVITNSLDIARLLAPAPGLRVKVAPGWVRANDDALVGGDTVAFVRRFVFDIAFMGIAACDADYGWMDYADEESELRRAVIEQTRCPVLLVDDSKFGRHASIRTFDLTTPLTVVTNRPVPAPFAEIFASAGVEVRHRLRGG
ncbi:MAG: DeoR/GlpR transcriptional regulator [Geminicoccaceae bacterium]|jgi:DeoR family glycerol-3-phosphate regulon repressor|nr:DeoR/GlpR transcriptional regulator [Geminicoccaceae bacterium]MCB9966147.1 DeoR/GlpR transcriptional regulator [Geminicoccaceae bacterium]HRY23140.1 DeoR/GlpR family DNA-binding transcription regulator [Geminicoccaceae bacterium]